MREKPCSCLGTSFADLPPEIRPQARKKSLLRKTTCPGCGREYWTNRDTDVCFDCEKSGVKTR